MLENDDIRTIIIPESEVFVVVGAVLGPLVVGACVVGAAVVRAAVIGPVVIVAAVFGTVVIGACVVGSYDINAEFPKTKLPEKVMILKQSIKIYLID